MRQWLCNNNTFNHVKTIFYYFIDSFNQFNIDFCHFLTCTKEMLCFILCSDTRKWCYCCNWHLVHNQCTSCLNLFFMLWSKLTFLLNSGFSCLSVCLSKMIGTFHLWPDSCSIGHCNETVVCITWFCFIQTCYFYKIFYMYEYLVTWHIVGIHLHLLL